VSKKDFIRFKKMNSKTTNIQLQELNSLSLNLKLNISQMLLANVHLGHRKKFLDIKIKPYLLGDRSNIYILNLTYTLLQFKILVALIVNLISLRQKFLIVKDRDLFKFREFLKLRNVFYYDKK
jgi:ribosomal protein S2